MSSDVVNWPTRLDTAQGTARVLARAWAQIRAGNLDLEDLELEEVGLARHWFGSQGIAPDPDDPEHVVGTAKWPPECGPRSWWFETGAALAVLATGDEVAVGAAHVALAPPDDERFRDSLVHRNAPVSDERARLGVIPPPYPPTPTGAHSASLATLTARAVAERVAGYADRQPVGLARQYRREAAAYESFATEIEASIASLTAPWLPLLARVLPPTPKAGVTPVENRVVATLRHP